MVTHYRSNIIEALLLFVLLIVSSYSLAEDKAVLPAQPPQKPLLETVENETVKTYLVKLKTYQSSIGGYVQGFGEGLDNFFGDKTLEIAGKGSHLDVQLPVRFYSGGEVDSRMNFKLQLDMPKTHKRWKLFVTSFDEDVDESVNPDALNRSEPQTTQTTETTNTEQQVGGRLLLGANKSRLSNVDVGLKFINYIEPNPFIKYRERFKYNLIADPNLEGRTTQTLYLEKDDGFAWELQQVFDHKIGDKELGRSQTELTWWKADRELLINQKFIHFQKPNPYRAKAYFINANWLAPAVDEIEFKSVAIATSIRDQIYSDWLFLEYEPRVTWLGLGDNKLSSPQYSFRLMLEMHFYK